MSNWYSSSEQDSSQLSAGVCVNGVSNYVPHGSMYNYVFVNEIAVLVASGWCKVPCMVLAIYVMFNGCLAFETWTTRFKAKYIICTGTNQMLSLSYLL